MEKETKRFYRYDNATEQRINEEGYDWFRAGVVIMDKNKKKVLVVQEAHGWIRGLWNIPVGHVKRGESILDAAKREAKEESGYTCALAGVCHIGQRCDDGNPYIAIIFVAEANGHRTEVDENDILEVTWKPIEEVLWLARTGQVRNVDMMLEAIDNVRDNTIGPLELVKIYAPR